MKFNSALTSLILASFVCGQVAYAALAPGNKKFVAGAPTPVVTASNSSLSHPLVNMKRLLQQMEASVDQNKAGIIQNDPTQAKTWYQRVTVSALINVDAGASNRTPSVGIVSPTAAGRYNEGNSSDISLSNATLFVDADVNDWVYGHMSLLYSDNRGIYQFYDQGNNAQGFETNRDEHNRVTLDEAFVRIRNFAKSPYVLQAGRFYLPFGDYQRYPIIQTLPQQLSMTQASAVEAGFIAPNGISALGYVFRGLPIPNDSINTTRRINNIGGQLAYQVQRGNVGGKVDVGYLFNMGDVDYISSTPFQIVGTMNNSRHVAGVAADALGYMGPFDAHINYVTAISEFPDINYGTHPQAEPQAIDVGAGFSFPSWGHASRIGFSYQRSWESANLGLGGTIPGAGLPRQRIQGDYTINIFKNTNVGLVVYNDHDYSVSEGGTGRTSLTGIVRLSVGLA